MATVEINDAVFCQQHMAEVCEDCGVDLREENDAFYGFDSVDRDALTCPPVSTNDDGIYICDQHDTNSCNVCFGWKKQITRLRTAAKKAGR
ncbi:hypothetical protein FVEN_g701 [Fusarium venenatum]|uniref:Uncharacterized protein n=1 Tax=Fusarium venenatum TaxID=56646 RepID=A0A2L2U3X6_9HYPO|nr:uncharacterized protein FVRRES_10897 [Fusarium venenatum]KAG8361130.1 hypothetical protein FVEN_g701 [Fusarium venenatum]KAH6967470.1 hypothetical protein EDB82DRAFT_518565 [Fusarium venenatum]CEI70820.1 unnamed protein product [Fusarium venenatum]